MKTKKHTRKINKSVIIVAVVLIVGLAAFLAYMFIFKPQLDASKNTVQSENTSSNQQRSDGSESNPDDKTDTPDTDLPAAPTTTPGSDKKQVQMVASTDQSNNTVYVRGGMNYPVNGGACYAQLSGPSGQSKRIETAVLSNPASTDCKTISLPISELTPGTWKLILTYTSDEYEGTSDEISFSL